MMWSCFTTWIAIRDQASVTQRDRDDLTTSRLVDRHRGDKAGNVSQPQPFAAAPYAEPRKSIAPSRNLLPSLSPCAAEIPPDTARADRVERDQRRPRAAATRRASTLRGVRRAVDG